MGGIAGRAIGRENVSAGRDGEIKGEKATASPTRGPTAGCEALMRISAAATSIASSRSTPAAAARGHSGYSCRDGGGHVMMCVIGQSVTLLH
jgi:hypothetical protein